MYKQFYQIKQPKECLLIVNLVSMMNQFDHNDFMEKTHSEVDIIKCRFGIIDCTAMMKTVKTMYGYCKQGQPSRFIGLGYIQVGTYSEKRVCISLRWRGGRGCLSIPPVYAVSQNRTYPACLALVFILLKSFIL